MSRCGYNFTAGILQLPVYNGNASSGGKLYIRHRLEGGDPSTKKYVRLVKNFVEDPTKPLINLETGYLSDFSGPLLMSWVFRNRRRAVKCGKCLTVVNGEEVLLAHIYCNHLESSLTCKHCFGELSYVDYREHVKDLD